MRYNNYHKHTHYSNIITPDSVVKVEDYAKRAVELGHTTLVTTEHGYAGNIFEYYNVAKQYNLKFVFGVEYYYVNDRFEKDKSNSHLMILAKNQSGMKQMQKIMSEASKTGYYYKPRIDKDLLFQLNPKDVVVTSTCVISYVNKHEDYEDNFIKPLHSYFGENFYLELHDNTHPMQVEYNKKILELHNKYKIPFIHATDSHYIYPEQDKERTAFLNGKNIFYPEEEGFILDYPSSDQIFERYEKQGVFTRSQVEEALTNTLIIDDFENIVLDKEVKMPSIYPNLSHNQKVDKLKETVLNEWKKDREHIPQGKHKDYQNAIKEEFSIIKDTQMEDYFLLNYEIIKRAKEKGGVLTRTGRGSAPSFYINKLLGFTEIDRLDAPVTLYSTRFMSKSRILESKSLPDIDFNTASPTPFIEASKEILGEDNVYYMIAYGTMKESASFRNLCRSKNLPMSEYNEVAKDLDKYVNDPKWADLIEESKKFLGVIDSASPHPCAFLLLNKPISEEVGLMKVGDELCALIDSSTSDEWKFLKNDLLTVSVWDIIAKTYELIGKPIHNIRELNKLIENDEKVWKLYKDGLTVTLNQTGTDSAKPQVKRYSPSSIRELSAFVAGIRPAFESMKDYLFDRKPFSYGIPEFDSLLKESDNFVLYQENIMSALIYVGFKEDETYGLLKAIAKKKTGIIEPIYERFMEGFIEKTGSRENAEKVWRIIEDSVSYGFNSSHALSVAYDSAYGAYLKANYPLEYYTVILNKYEGNIEMTNKIYNELPYFDIKVIPIKYGKSKDTYTPDKKSNSIYKGVASIKYLNGDVAKDLYELSCNHKFNNFVDLLFEAHNNTNASFKHLRILTSLNFFDTFGKNQKLLSLIDEYESKLKNKKLKDETKEKRMIELRELEQKTENKSLSIQEQIKLEMEYYGYEVTTVEKSPNSVYMVTGIDTKYTPKLRLYKISNGEILEVKCKKADMKKNEFGEFSIVQVKKLSERYKRKKINEEWVQTDEKELYLSEWNVLN